MAFPVATAALFSTEDWEKASPSGRGPALLSLGLTSLCKSGNTLGPGSLSPTLPYPICPVGSPVLLLLCCAFSTSPIKAVCLCRGSMSLTMSAVPHRSCVLSGLPLALPPPITSFQGRAQSSQVTVNFMSRFRIGFHRSDFLAIAPDQPL